MVRLLAGWLGLLLLLTPLSSAAAEPVTLYIALGDSVASGAGASTMGHSYVGRELERLRAERGQVRLVMLASGGATSEGMLRWQTPRAVQELEAIWAGQRPGQRPGPVTITIGGNDLLALLWRGGLSGQEPTPAMIEAQIAQVEANLGVVLERLVVAGGPRMQITVTTYYDPFVVLPPGHPTRQQAATWVPLLNQAIMRAAARYPDSVRVAAVHAVLPDGPAIGGYLADSIHPSDQGHERIATAVAAAWRVRLPDCQR